MSITGNYTKEATPLNIGMNDQPDFVRFISQQVDDYTTTKIVERFFEVIEKQGGYFSSKTEAKQLIKSQMQIQSAENNAFICSINKDSFNLSEPIFLKVKRVLSFEYALENAGYKANCEIDIKIVDQSTQQPNGVVSRGM